MIAFLTWIVTFLFLTLLALGLFFLSVVVFGMIFGIIAAFILNILGD